MLFDGWCAEKSLINAPVGVEFLQQSKEKFHAKQFDTSGDESGVLEA